MALTRCAQFTHTIGSDTTRGIVPDAANGHVLVIVHGAGDSNNSPNFAPLEAYYQAFLDYGLTFISTDAGGDAWGNQASLDAYVAAYDYWTTTGGLTLDKTFIQGGSMGGAAALQIVANRLLPRIVGYLGIFNVADLLAMDSHVPPTYASSIRTAWGASDHADLAVKVAGKNPVSISAATYPAIRCRFYHSTADQVVDKAANTDAIAAVVALNAIEVVVISTAGDHGDIDNFRQTEVIDDLFIPALADGTTRNDSIFAGRVH